MKSSENKFVIFSQSRSGSTLLKELIGSHPSIHCEGEILALSDGYITNRYILKICRKIPVPYFYFRKRMCVGNVYGFTLFVYHSPYIKQSIHRLSKLGWKIVYLKRRDIINQAISNIVAHRNQYFHNMIDNDLPENVDFEINREEFLSEIKRRIHWHQTERDILMNIDHLPIFYEKDLENLKYWQPTADRIFQFLNMDSSEVNSGLKKTYKKPYSELVSNYQNLIELLKESKLNDKLESIMCDVVNV